MFHSDLYIFQETERKKTVNGQRIKANGMQKYIKYQTIVS